MNPHSIFKTSSTQLRVMLSEILLAEISDRSLRKVVIYVYKYRGDAVLIHSEWLRQIAEREFGSRCNADHIYGSGTLRGFGLFNVHIFASQIALRLGHPFSRWRMTERDHGSW